MPKGWPHNLGEQHSKENKERPENASRRGDSCGVEYLLLFSLCAFRTQEVSCHAAASMPRALRSSHVDKLKGKAKISPSSAPSLCCRAEVIITYTPSTLLPSETLLVAQGSTMVGSNVVYFPRAIENLFPCTLFHKDRCPPSALCRIRVADGYSQISLFCEAVSDMPCSSVVGIENFCLPPSFCAVRRGEAEGRSSIHPVKTYME